MADDGFDYQGYFYPLHVSDVGRDLMLIDRFSGLPYLEFLNLVDDEHERTRGPIMLTLIATSMQHARPEWSVNRIERTVLALHLSDVTFISGDEAERETEGAPQAVPPPPEPTAAEPDSSPTNGSSPSSTPEESSTSETSYASPV